MVWKTKVTPRFNFDVFMAGTHQKIDWVENNNLFTKIPQNMTNLFQPLNLTVKNYFISKLSKISTREKLGFNEFAKSSTREN